MEFHASAQTGLTWSGDCLVIGLTEASLPLIGPLAELNTQVSGLLQELIAETEFTGKDHWQVLLQARAIENTCYVIAPAQTGFHNSRRQSHGHAMIIDPWGMVLADAGTSTGVAIAEINPNRLAQVRRQMPSLSHRMFV
jgi:predicted amidohydrolase